MQYIVRIEQLNNHHVYYLRHDIRWFNNHNYYTCYDWQIGRMDIHYARLSLNYLKPLYNSQFKLEICPESRINKDFSFWSKLKTIFYRPMSIWSTSSVFSHC